MTALKSLKYNYLIDIRPTIVQYHLHHTGATTTVPGAWGLVPISTCQVLPGVALSSSSN